MCAPYTRRCLLGSVFHRFPCAHPTPPETTVHPPGGIPYCPPPSDGQSLPLTHPMTATGSPLSDICGHSCDSSVTPGALFVPCCLQFCEPNIHSSFIPRLLALSLAQEAESPVTFHCTFCLTPSFGLYCI